MLNNDKPKIAVVASFGLGDGMIFLIIANNLQRNGYDVTFYNNFTAQMQDWLPHIRGKSYPDTDKMLQEMLSYDLVFSEALTPLTVDFKPEQLHVLNFVVVGAASFSKELVFDVSERLVLKYTNSSKLEKLLRLAAVSGLKIVRDKKLSMVEALTLFCREQLKFENAVSDTGLIVPNRGLVNRKFVKRIIIHPLSISEYGQKNWQSKKYIKLAKMLKKNDWNPVFILSLKEKSLFPIFENSGFAVPEFKTILELAAFVFESGWMIGNDSGIGHLASNFHIPTVTITKKYKNYRWRPCWFHGIMVTSSCRIKIINKYFWKYFISVRKVFNAFNGFVSQMLNL